MTLPNTATETTSPQPASLPAVWNALVVASDDPTLATALESAIRLRGPAVVSCGWNDLHELSVDTLGTPQLLVLGAQATTSLAELLEQVHRYAAKTPVVVCLAEYNEDTLIALYDAGVADVVFPPMPPVHLAARVLEALERDTLQKQWLQRDAVLQALQQRDAATGLWSPDAWLALLTHTLQTNQTGHSEHGMMVLPLPSNTSTETVATVGRVLLSTLRGTDAWALLDGPKADSPKKLVVLLSHTPTTQVAGVVQRVCNLLQHHQLALTPADWKIIPIQLGDSTLAVVNHLSSV